MIEVVCPDREMEFFKTDKCQTQFSKKNNSSNLSRRITGIVFNKKVWIHPINRIIYFFNSSFARFRTSARFKLLTFDLAIFSSSFFAFCLSPFLSQAAAL